MIWEVSFLIPQETRCCGNHFLLVLSASIHRIWFACHSVDGGVRQEVQVLHCAQANQLIDQLTVINRRFIEGQPAGRTTDRLCIASSCSFDTGVYTFIDAARIVRGTGSVVPLCLSLSVCPITIQTVCAIDRQQQRRAAGLLLSALPAGCIDR